jgi:hypothetical protein
MNRLMLVPLLTAVVLSGCSDTAKPASSATPSSSVSPKSSTSTSISPSPSPSAVPAEDSPLPPQVQMVIDTDHGPADLLVGHHVLFVGTHRGGSIQRIDPKTNRIDATVTVGGQLVLESSTSAGGLSAVDESKTWLWACSNTDGVLHQIDPRAMRVTATVKAKCDGGWRTRVGDNLWAVPGSETDALLVVGIESGKVIRRTPLSDPGWGWGPAVLAGDRVIIGAKHTAVLSTDGTILERLKIQTPYLNSTGGKTYRIWPDGSMEELDATTLEVRRSFHLPPVANGDPVLVADNAGHLFYRPDSTHVYQVGDDGTAQLLLTLPAAETPTAMAWAFGSLWITNFDDDTVWRVDPLA